MPTKTKTLMMTMDPHLKKRVRFQEKLVAGGGGGGGEKKKKEGKQARKERRLKMLGS